MSHELIDSSLWPYDEVRLSRGQSDSQYKLSAPWVSLLLSATEDETSNLEILVNKFETNSLAPEDREKLSWLLSALSHFPIAYYLPRALAEISGPDPHSLLDRKLVGVDRRAFLSRSVSKINPSLITENQSEWTWPQEDALAFSKIADDHQTENEKSLYDPYSLFSVARRFSLVEAAEHSQTNALFKSVEKLKDHPQKYKAACAIIVRQNHYVTEQCNASLTPALSLAQSSINEVDEFIRSEQGHDKILTKAVESFGQSAEDLEVMPTCRGLMELLKLSGTRNLLAFSLAVDIFERTTYVERDPLATLLDSAGLKTAAKQIDIHKGINDSGSHENVALSFLSHMAPVDAEYAKEALNFAEMISFFVQQVSREISDRIDSIENS